MKTNALRIVFLAALVLFIGACADTAVDAGKVYKGDYSSYLAVLNEWTRSGKIYHNFETELIVNASYYSKTYRDALRRETARAEKLLPDEIARRERQDDHELKTQARFLVCAYTTMTGSNNLADPSPSFRLWLKDVKGRQVAPIKIKEVKFKREADALIRPYINEWSKNYEVTFPIADDSGAPLQLAGGRITLVAAGMQGTAELAWDIP
jgi:hypothetical protein